MAAVSVVVPARDAAGTLGRTLAGIAAQEVEHEVVVADDGSRDATAEVAERAGARVVRLAAAGGPGAARRAGAAAARGDVLAFTDADCVPAPGWLAAGLRALEDGADLVQGRVTPPPGEDVGPFDRTVAVGAAIGLFESANLLVRREVYDRAGGFGPGIDAPAERLGGRVVPAKHLGEDVEFGWRAVRAGARTAFAVDALVHHAVERRDAIGFVAERRRLRHFPALVRDVPELRDAFLWRRWFLTRRGAAFDLAAAGVAAAAARRSPAPLLAAAPYAWLVGREAIGWRSPAVGVAGVAADAVGCAALLRGSVATGTVVL
jgi:glycosyltransferase involved in cell wall biosynthesis